MLITNVFDSKVVGDQRERDGSPLVLPQTGSRFALRIAMFLQSFEPIHAHAYLTVHVSIWGCNVAQFVVFDDVVWHVREF